MRRKDGVPVCPVTFVKDKPVCSTDLNNMFVMPYTLYASGTLLRACMYDYIKETPEYAAHLCKKDKYYCDDNFWMYEDKHRAASRAAIDSYIKMNITNLVFETLYKFSVDAFQMNKFTFDDATFQIGLGHMDIPKIVDDTVRYRCHLTGKLKEENPIGINIIFDTIMDAICADLTNLIFNQFIINIATTKHQALQDLFAYFWSRGGKEPTEEEISKVPIDMMYSFVTAMLREVMESHLGSFRASLTIMVANLKNMVQYNPDYFLDLNKMKDPNYRAGDMYNNNPMLTDHISRNDVSMISQMVAEAGGNFIDEVSHSRIPTAESGETK